MFLSAFRVLDGYFRLFNRYLCAMLLVSVAAANAAGAPASAVPLLPAELSTLVTAAIRNHPAARSAQAIAVTVTDVNEAPTYEGSSGRTSGVDDYITMQTNTPISEDLQSLFDDPDGDTLTYSLASGTLPDGLSLSTAGVISGTLTASVAKYDGIIINVSDNTLSVEHTFLLDVVV
jgi:hypothetical protein